MTELIALSKEELAELIEKKVQEEVAKQLSMISIRDDETLLSIADVCDKYKISSTKFWRIRRDHKIPFQLVGKNPLFKIQDLEEFFHIP